MLRLYEVFNNLLSIRKAFRNGGGSGILYSTHSNTCNIDGRVGPSRYIGSSLYRHAVADDRRKKEAHKSM